MATTTATNTSAFASSGMSTAESEPPTPASTEADAAVGAPGGGEANCPGVRCLSIVVTGDVLLHPPLLDQARRDDPTGAGFEFTPMLSAQAPYVTTADLGICHLETPLAPPEGPFTGYPEFSVPPQILTALAAVGYDACSTASNHSMDQASAGLRRTLDDLDAAGLAHDGSYRTPAEAAAPTVISTENGRVSLISVTYGLNTGPADPPWRVSTLDTQAILAEAAAARAAGADLVVVAVHAGTEYDTEPNTDQRVAAEELLFSPDIDLVYGHHAHVAQPLQQINGKWVIYGLGNNIAAHATPVDATREGLLVRVTFSQDPSGVWTTSDVAWVASLQDAGPPHRWCPLTSNAICDSPEVDAAVLARTTDVVNRYGADTAGAHPLDQP